jgi:hypothetical protein
MPHDTGTFNERAPTAREERMTDPLRLEDVRQLLGTSDGPRVSIYLPMEGITTSGTHDRLVLKGALTEAEAALASDGMRSPAIAALLAPGRALLDDPLFWRHRSEGVAVFLAPGWHRIHRLPISPEELVFVGAHFDVKPLLGLFVDEGRYLVLALSQGGTRLFACDRGSAREVPLGETPTTLAEALRYDDLEKERQFHVAGRGGAGAPVVSHGHGVGDEVDRELLVRFLRGVDEGVRAVTEDGSRPLVLAGTATVVPVFREVTRYPAVVKEAVAGNPERLRAEELRDRAWPLVRPVFAARREAALARYQAAAGKGGAIATDDPEAVLRAAMEGRVDTLFVAVGKQRWGKVNPGARSIIVHTERLPADEDLLDVAAIDTLLTSGTVFALPSDEVPGGTVAAILRY